MKKKITFSKLFLSSLRFFFLPYNSLILFSHHFLSCVFGSVSPSWSLRSIEHISGPQCFLEFSKKLDFFLLIHLPQAKRFKSSFVPHGPPTALPYFVKKREGVSQPTGPTKLINLISVRAKSSWKNPLKNCTADRTGGRSASENPRERDNVVKERKRERERERERERFLIHGYSIGLLRLNLFYKTFYYFFS